MTSVLLLSLGTAAWAQVPPTTSATPAPAPEPTPAPAEPPPPATVVPAPQPAPATTATADVAELQRQLAALQAELEALRASLGDGADTSELGREVEQIKALLESGEARPVGNLTRMDDAKIRLAGYLDVGFFDAQGDGVSYVRDEGHSLFPQHADVPWVFYGDPWANPVNAQGDSADLGLDRTNIDRWDPIASGGAPSFIVNMVNQAVLVTFRDDLLLEASINFEPRDGTELDRLGAPGDYLDVDLAYAEWIPFQNQNFHLFAGKFEPVFGLEYRNRKASERFGITPSLISRYTTGSPTGLKVRGALLNEIFVYAFAFTNGASNTERFAHFYNEIDDNFGKTGSGRLSIVFPLPFFLEVGASGTYGTQDGQPDDAIVHSQAGADLRFRAGDVTIEGEILFFSKEDGGGLQEAAFLDAKGWYAQARYLVLPGLGVYARADRRKADLLADTNLYVSDTLRFTGGVRLDITFNAIVKAEYLHVLEVDQPTIDNDVITTSLVLRY